MASDLPPDEHHPAVLRTAGLRAVVDNGVVGAFADSTHYVLKKKYSKELGSLGVSAEDYILRILGLEETRGIAATPLLPFE